MSFNLKSALLVATLLAAPAFAQSDEDKAEVNARVQEITASLEKGDMVALTRGLPDRMITAMAEQSGLDKDTFLQMVEQTVSSSASGITFSDVQIGGDGTEWKKTSDGKDYAIVPFNATVGAEGQPMKIRQEGTLVAIKDDGKWYLLDLGEQNKAVFASVYPEYAGIDVPAAKQSAVQ